MNKSFKNYIAPSLTVVTFKAERGYAESSIPDKIAGQVDMYLEMELENGEAIDGTFNSQNLEGYNNHEEWGSVSQGNHFFE